MTSHHSWARRLGPLDSGAGLGEGGGDVVTPRTGSLAEEVRYGDKETASYQRQPPAQTYESAVGQQSFCSPYRHPRVAWWSGGGRLGGRVRG